MAATLPGLDPARALDPSAYGAPGRAPRFARLLLALVTAGDVAQNQRPTGAPPALPSRSGAPAPPSCDAPADARTEARQVQPDVNDALEPAALARQRPDDI